MNLDGAGQLFTDPSANHAREVFAARSRALTDKLTTVADAVRRFVQDGDYLAIGGFGADRLPTAVVHEILRQGKQNLRFAGHTATHDFQLLCAGNLTGRGQTLAAVDIAYIVGLEARGLSPHARRVMESGEVAFTEWTNYALAVRLKAAAMGVPFLPARTMLGTDTFKHSAAKIIVCPFTGQTLAALPALYPDVAAIHVHEADRYGNCRIRGTTVADLELARAAKRLIITCERLIPHDVIRQDPTLTVIPFFCVDAVCEVPFGSYPGNMPYEYFSDETHLRQWLDVEKDLEPFQAFLAKYIYGVKDFAEYLQLCGGLPRMQELRQQEFLLHRGK
ncbi:glutaconate CoA-transferase [Planctomycetaceae bacterium SCGC AG-212-F19]|nr:glutaconate CoA-transferase [Planctomycetaceae bacterium SCGC AG-212-F19]